MFKAGEKVLYKGRLYKVVSVGKGGFLGTIRLRLFHGTSYIRVKPETCILASSLMKELF